MIEVVHVCTTKTHLCAVYVYHKILATEPGGFVGLVLGGRWQVTPPHTFSRRVCLQGALHVCIPFIFLLSNSLWWKKGCICGRGQDMSWRRPAEVPTVSNPVAMLITRDAGRCWANWLSIFCRESDNTKGWTICIVDLNYMLYYFGDYQGGAVH